MGVSVPQTAAEPLVGRGQPVLVASASRERIVSVDALRLVATLGIIWFHLDQVPFRQIGYAGLPVFLLIFYSLIVRQGPTYTTLGFLARRWRRLLQPWLFWSVLYGLGHLAKTVYFADWDSLSDMVCLRALLTGAHIHLWYLPYAFLSGFLLYELNVRTCHRNHTAVAVGATVVAVATLTAYARGVLNWSATPPLVQWQFALAAFPLGFAIGRCLMVPSRGAQKALLAAVSLATAALYLVLSLQGRAGPVVPYVLAVVLVCLAYIWQVRANMFITALGPLTLGVYLIHPAVVLGLRRVLAADRHAAASLVLTAGISGLITWGLMKTPVRRFL